MTRRDVRRQRELIELLASNVFVFDLLDRGDGSWLERGGLIAKLEALEPLAQTGEIFKTVLTLEDEVRELQPQ
eukprot:SAG11_NODE_3451_length_2440_cov_5.412217_3_plen_73_part_00